MTQEKKIQLDLISTQMTYNFYLIKVYL